MDGVANAFNEAGLHLHARNRLRLAHLAYACASFLAPAWSAPWFNRGLIAKLERRWADCRAFNRRAAELDPNDPPSWWNLGIAATALGDWDTARRAWSAYGLHVPPGEGPIDMDLGMVPVRVVPEDRGEVVWCRRLDPARAVVLSIPTPESGRGCGDLVLHDGEAKGSRLLEGSEVPVFDELALLRPGPLHTFAVQVTAPSRTDVEELEGLSVEGEIAVEDWPSSVTWLCRQCSEGAAHEHPGETTSDWEAERTVGVAAPTEGVASILLAEWAGRGPGRRLGPIECVLRRE